MSARQPLPSWLKQSLPPAFRGNCECGRWLIVPVAVRSKNRLFCQCGRSYWYDADRGQFDREVHPVIFLDIDGVLITMESRTTAHKPTVEALNSLIARSSAVIVVSSSRRKAGLDHVAGDLGRWGVIAKIVGVTPDLSRTHESGILQAVTRGKEISTWLQLNERRYTRFVILDDEADMTNVLPLLIQTDYATGLTMQDADKALEVLLAPS